MDTAKIDRHFRLLLGELRSQPDSASNSRTLALAGTTLTILQNPLNITLLTSQVLTAPAIWSEDDGLESCVRCMNVFRQAAAILVRQERESAELKNAPEKLSVQHSPSATNIRREEWIKAVFRGADERSPAWSHTLVLAGMILGFQGTSAGQSIGSGIQFLTRKLTQVVNQALQELLPEDELGRACISLVLAYCSEHLSTEETHRLDHNRLLPTLVKSAFMSNEGYKAGYFVGGIDLDIIQQPAEKFTWSSTSLSFQRIASLSANPLHAAMGSLAKVIAATIGVVSDTRLIHGAIADLASFARTVQLQWRQTKLSEVDASEESLYFDDHALNVTLPVLWKLLRHAVFGSILILRSVLARTLSLSALGSDSNATIVAEQSLQLLRSLYFVSNRLGVHSFQQHTFVYLTAVDILLKHSTPAITFIRSISPVSLGKIPRHPLDRNLDLYFLNTAEHFASILPSQLNDELLVAAASPYLAEGGNKNLLEIFEAAHSVMLAVLSSPSSVELASKYVPFYVDALFKVFPSNISSRQFRLAYRTLLEICSPPRPLSGTHPELTQTLLELLRHRAGTQLDLNRATPYTAPVPTREYETKQRSPLSPSLPTEDEQLDERTALTLTLIDCLSIIPVEILEDWLTLTADLIGKLESDSAKQRARGRLWEALSGGEMDVERSRVCVAWWSTKNGRESVLEEELEDSIVNVATLKEEARGRTSKL